jgi:hypothetical protein
MDERPLIRFADGPSGRRARPLGGPDVWEVIAVARDNDGDLAETAAYLELSLGLAAIGESGFPISESHCERLRPTAVRWGRQ